MKPVAKFSAILDRIIDFSALLADILIIFVMLIIVAAIVLRPMGIPLPWVMEVSEYSLLWITLLGAAWLLKRGGHVKIDLLFSRLNLKTQTILNIVISIFGVIACLTITWFGIQVTKNSFLISEYYSGTDLSLPKYPIVAVVPIGFFLLFIQFLRATWGYSRSLGAKNKGSER